MPDHPLHETAGYNLIVNAIKTMEELILKNTKREDLAKELMNVNAVAQVHLAAILPVLKEIGPTCSSGNGGTTSH